MSKIWVVAEQHGGEPVAAALELLAGARAFADDVDAVVWGAGSAEAAAILGAHGAKRVYDVGDVGDSLPAPRVSAAIEQAITAGEGPDALFIATSYDGRDIAARCSARLNRPVLTNIVGIKRVDDALVSEHACFGGTEIVSARFSSSGLGIFVIRPNTFEASKTGGAPAEVVPLAVPELGPTNGARVVASHSSERMGPSLDEARIIVSGGRGLGSKDNYELIEQLAHLLKAAPGASRAIVDSGWVPYSYQVGQTGKIVKPAAYLAFGISGALQHLVGMKNAQYIIAVNKDPSAPIFGLADLGIVGDALDILPRLIATLEAAS